MNEESIQEIRSYLANGGTWGNLIIQVEYQVPEPPKSRNPLHGDNSFDKGLMWIFFLIPTIFIIITLGLKAFNHFLT